MGTLSYCHLMPSHFIDEETEKTLPKATKNGICTKGPFVVYPGGPSLGSPPSLQVPGFSRSSPSSLRLSSLRLAQDSALPTLAGGPGPSQVRLSGLPGLGALLLLREELWVTASQEGERGSDNGIPNPISDSMADPWLGCPV